VPVGTTVSIDGSSSTYEILHEGQEVRLLKGGAGGFGNTHFKSSVHQNPFEHTEGRAGESGNITLTLKIIADLGIIGLPNAGKSSLINALTRAKSKVGAYPFTTLEPHLGEFYGFILADIPGLIEGASTGRGLGTKFLKHIERTGCIAHLVSAEQDDPIIAYREVRREVEQYGKGLAEKDEFLVISKADLVSKEDLEEKVSLLEKELGKKVYTVSTQDSSLLKHFSDELIRELQGHTQSS
jgi:GTP-binding protein